MDVAGMDLKAKCEECGQIYSVPRESLKERKNRFRCKYCGNIFTVERPEEDWEPGAAPDSESPSSWMKNGGEPAYGGSGKKTRTSSAAPPPPSDKKDYIFGLTSKFIAFTILPMIIIMLAVIWVSDNRMRVLQNETIEDSTTVVRSISEGLIQQISETVARQTRQYLFSHPDLQKEDFNRDIYFKKVALQSVGITGSTSLIEIPGPGGIWRTWAHQNAEIVGKDLQLLEGRLGNDFSDFWRIITGLKDGEISSGYYRWPDEEGRLREKFMVATPVEGTTFAIAASIFADEFTLPLEHIEARGDAISEEMRFTLVSVLGGGLLLIFAIILFYGRSITGKIRRLADWTDRISMGELESEGVKYKRKDEISDLIEAIDRMQDSIRLSMERLRRRRKK
jgi:HAMP domain-containing protein/DNA-directed RNA polymerase subunit RPC12/RpoP